MAPKFVWAVLAASKLRRIRGAEPQTGAIVFPVFGCTGMQADSSRQVPFGMSTKVLPVLDTSNIWRIFGEIRRN